MLLAEQQDKPLTADTDRKGRDLCETLEAIDETIHQKVRLGIMSALIAQEECDFRFLKETLGVTDGNLSIHIAKLEEAGYLSVRKEFVRRKPRTTYQATQEGRDAFRSYLRLLEEIVARAGQSAHAERKAASADA